MDSKKEFKVDVIAKVSKGNFSIEDASKLLSKSQRTIERYVSAFEKKGIQFAIHGNMGREPVNKISGDKKKQVQDLIRDKYPDLNLTHLSEQLIANEKIEVKRETLRRWAHEIHHVKREKRRRKKVRKRRERMPSPGLMLQMDGSHHKWFGNEKSCLIGIIDDADSRFYGKFFRAETTMGCMEVLKDVVAERGKFKTLYVDRAGLFGGSKRSHFSQVERACEELGIEIIFANSAQGKGRIERAFDTCQDRLVAELRMKKIVSMREANEYLIKEFIPNYWNKRLTVEPTSIKSEYEKIDRKRTDLKSVFCIKKYRKVNNDHTFNLDGKQFLIDSQLESSIAKFKIEVRTSLDDKTEYYFANQKLLVTQIKEPTQKSIREIELEHRLKAVELTHQIKSITKAAKQTGISRQKIARDRDIIKKHGKKFFVNNFKKGFQTKTDKKLRIEEKLLLFCLENPQLGDSQVVKHLNKEYNIDISTGTVRNIWLAHNMETIAKRVLKAKTQRHPSKMVKP